MQEARPGAQAVWPASPFSTSRATWVKARSFDMVEAVDRDLDGEVLMTPRIG